MKVEERGFWYKRASLLQTSEPNATFLYNFHSTGNLPADPDIFGSLNSRC